MASRVTFAETQGRTAQSLSDEQIKLVLLASDIASAVSTLGSVFILACYFKFKNLRKFAFSLVAILSATDVLNQVTEFIQPSPAEIDSSKGGQLTPTCLVQALTDSFFELSSVLWTSAIAATLYLVVFYRMDQAALYGQLKWMALVCYGIPTLMMVLPLADQRFGPYGAYGVAGAWCWIPSTDDRYIWQFVVFYIPLIIAIIFNAVVYLRTYALLQRTVQSVGETDTAAEQLRAVMKRLQLYPLVLAIIWAPAIVNRVYEAATGNQVFGLYFAQKVFSSSQGLWNAVVYGLSQGVREALQAQLAAWFPKYFTDPTVATAGSLLNRHSLDRSASKTGFAPGRRGRPGDHEPLQPGPGGAPGRAGRLGVAGMVPDDEDDGEDVDDITVAVPPRASGLGLGPDAVGAAGHGGHAASAGGPMGGPGPAVRVIANPVAGVGADARQGRVAAMMQGQGQGQAPP